jgi:hypothetical protein
MNQTCIDCKRTSPPNRTDQTLLSASHGWRLLRVSNPDGSFSLQWRCAACWSRYKQAQEKRTHQAGPAPLESPRGIFRAARRIFRRDSEKPPVPEE